MLYSQKQARGKCARSQLHHIKYINLIFTPWQSDTYENAKAAEEGKASWISAIKISHQYGEQSRNLVAAHEQATTRERDRQPETSGAADSDSAARGINTLEQSLVEWDCDM